tara:strand:+ start:10180 stop:10608 length:429 start_codon:yes stop_codon:yes gene_type:complete
MRSSYLEPNSSVSNLALKYEEIAAAKTLTAADSGKVFGINQASAYEITLPLAATAGIGWHCKFVLSTVASNAVTIANNTDEDTIVGHVVGADASAGNSQESAVDEIVFISGAALGDTVEIFCNGVNYFAKAQCHDVAHVTIS